MAKQQLSNILALGKQQLINGYLAINTVGTTPSEIQNQSFLSFVLMEKFQHFSSPTLI